ncbi:hypothetical protein B7P43_G07101 [Cryptotermes secundus]|uniref:Mos1 transposase HTH domain-containing protein n=1 Tax=Cryptotermes secundus TaxID=105785 RepID=A0A2J7Q246_9NEOP|nr:hypothetical protein B7P43_G07101 [Cryptotermes secundus]
MCTKEEQRTVIRFRWLEGVSGAESHQRLSAQYGDTALPRRSVYEWIEKFKSGRRSVTHEEGAARPSTSTTDEKNQQPREMVLANRRVTIDEVACSLQISHGSAHQIIHDELGFHKVCARWVPRELTAEHKRKRLLSKKVLLNGNARPHMAGQTVGTINHLGFEVLEHPAYSPDLAPSDCHLFGPLKDALRGRRFSTDEEAVQKRLRDQTNSFFLEGIRKLVERWTKCIEKEGDYVENDVLVQPLLLCI